MQLSEKVSFNEQPYALQCSHTVLAPWCWGLWQLLLCVWASEEVALGTERVWL